jgi:FtsP/CotA-like multicopper oxidase with cupredoxin domain
MIIKSIVLTVLLYNSLPVKMTLVEYDFIVRTIPSNPDGYPRPAIIMYPANSSWNAHRPFPGPLIQATLGDTLRIRITNMMRDQATAIHFHGLHMFANPWADGTEYITQCPIAPHETFTYEFQVTQTGTFWYHSHNGQQYADGLVGPMIFRQDPIEQNYNYFRNDYIMMLQEWYHETWSDLMTAYQGPYGAYPGNVPIYPWPPTSFLINGHGQFDCRTSDCSENATWRDECGHTWPVQCVPLRAPFLGPCKINTHPIDDFSCPYGQQIRLRLINAASGIPFRFWIDQHNFTIVSRDSIEIQPVTVDYLHISIGQRLDLIITCNQDPSFKYIIFVASRNSYMPAHLITGPTPTMWTTAHLVYSNSTASVRSSNAIERLDDIPDDPFFEYKAFKPVIERFAFPAVRRVTLAFAVHWNNREGIDALEEWGVNNITFEPPREPLLQANFFDGTLEYSLANEYPGLVNNTHATHIHHFDYGQTYEVLMINDDPQQHPWHLHGYSVDFIAAGKLPHIPPPSCSNSNQQRKIRANSNSLEDILPALNSTPLVLSTGDSFNVPRESYVVFRFTANNPGPWFFHCHMDWHISPGLALVFSVAKNGSYKNLIQSPPDNFPICGQRNRLMHIINPAPIASSNIAELEISLVIWVATIACSSILNLEVI